MKKDKKPPFVLHADGKLLQRGFTVHTLRLRAKKLSTRVLVSIVDSTDDSVKAERVNGVWS